MSHRLKFTLIPCGILAALCATVYFRGSTRPTDRERVAVAREAVKQSDIELQIYKALYQKIQLDLMIRRMKHQMIKGTAERYQDDVDHIAYFEASKLRESASVNDIYVVISKAEKLLQKIRRLENVQAWEEIKQ